MKKIDLVLFVLISGITACNMASKNRAKRDSPNDTTVTTPPATQEVKLPAPYETKSSIKICEVIGWETNSSPKAPNGFKVTRFAENLHNPRWIYVLPNGDILVAEAKPESKGVKKVAEKVIGMDKAYSEAPNLNRISLFRDNNKDGIPDMRTTFLQGVNLPFGMLLLNGYFYVAATDAVYRYKYTEGDTVVSSQGEKLASLPPQGRHWTRNIITDGTKIYIAVGSASNVAEDGMDKEHNRACILSMNPDGSELKMYASGLRNPVGLDFQPGTKTLYTTVNERDELGDDLVPDYLTSVKEGGFYGWPYSYFGKNKDPRIKDEEQRMDLVNKAIVPDFSLGNHTASLGLCFYTRDEFPKGFKNGAFVAQHGSWNRSVLSGYKVVFITFKNNKPVKSDDFLTGFIADEPSAKVYGRPVGVAVDSKGALLVTDDASNTVWRVSYK